VVPQIRRRERIEETLEYQLIEISGLHAVARDSASKPQEHRSECNHQRGRPDRFTVPSVLLHQRKDDGAASSESVLVATRQNTKCSSEAVQRCPRSLIEAHSRECFLMPARFDFTPKLGESVV
jgi:hypothetical protein